MPSFSLVRRFGKQRKAIIDSSVSSGLVEQHVGHTMAESSHSESRISQQSQAGNVFSSFPALNSHELSSGLVTLSPHIEGVSIRDINAPVMSNNHFNITNHYQSQAKDSDATLRIGDIYLEEEVGEYSDVNDVRGTKYKARIVASSMSIWSYCGERTTEEFEKAYQVYASLPRHPNILQLYGICRSMQFMALAFHGGPCFMDRRVISFSLTDPEQSAHNMLQQHGLRGWRLAISDVDETGKLVVADFFPDPTDHSAFDTHIWMAFATNTFIKEDLLDYYKFLFDMIDIPSSHTSILPSPFNKAVPIQLSHPEINLPVYSLPGWNKMDTTVGETGIVLTFLPNMTICDTTLFATWACQANHQIHDLPINIMDLQTGKLVSFVTFNPMLNDLLETKYLYLFCPAQDTAKIYWSRDEQGQHIIEDSLIQASFGIVIDWDWDWNTYVYPIPPQFYGILSTIHEACGFDPYSTQVAEYLGLPWAVIDNAHLGLEEYVEDPEYSSESESGDSDYVSASEDV
ncbi:hypothetical protein C8J56DRAFT_1081911 [Mycena floridula]|nr:hypothetical protein C8J56DRAFT_1081911 [Mycena floridula]